MRTALVIAALAASHWRPAHAHPRMPQTPTQIESRHRPTEPADPSTAMWNLLLRQATEARALLRFPLARRCATVRTLLRRHVDRGRWSARALGQRLLDDQTRRRERSRLAQALLGVTSLRQRLTGCRVPLDAPPPGVTEVTLWISPEIPRDDPTISRRR